MSFWEVDPTWDHRAPQLHPLGRRGAAGDPTNEPQPKGEPEGTLRDALGPFLHVGWTVTGPCREGGSDGPGTLCQHET